MRRPFKKKHELAPDSKYESLRVAKFINNIMESGKKNVAERVVYDAFEEIKKQTKKDPMDVFETALRNVAPTIEVRSRRVGGANYQVPYEVRLERQSSLSMRWILEAARAKKGVPMYKRLANELIAASNEEGEAIKKKESMRRMAEANKAFAHFAFGRKKKKKLPVG